MLYFIGANSYTKNLHLEKIFSQKKFVERKEPPCGEKEQVVVEGDERDDVAASCKVIDIPLQRCVVMQDDKCHLGGEVDVSVVVYPFPMCHILITIGRG